MSSTEQDTLSLTERDLKVIWHPYTQMLHSRTPTAIVRAEGSNLFDENGKRYIDAISSWWVILHGHSHPYIADRVSAQIRKLDQVIFAGFTHEPAVDLAEKLLNLLPQNQQKVFYTDNGSTAVEVALKMCVQYWHNQGQSRRMVLAFHHGYHGDTFGAMSVSGRSAWTAPFDAYLFEVLYIETPTAENLDRLKKQISEVSSQLACFVYEPLVQGSAGMLMYGAAELDELMNHCRSENVLMIQDEVFTGFGRTGKHFAANHLKEVPDVMCFSKGLTGGTMPLGVTTCSEDIYNAFLSKDKLKTLFHGHSFTANPLACTAASASIDLLLREETQQHIERICRRHAGFIKRIGEHMRVESARQTGTILAIEWRTETGTSYFDDLRDLLYDYFLNRGILMRPLGNVIYVLPPYCISDEDLDHVYDEIEGALELY